MPIYGSRSRFFTRKIHFLDCNCECDLRRLELQRVLDNTHAGLTCKPRSFTGTSDKGAYSEYHAIGHPKTIRSGNFGKVGDIFIDLTPLSHKLYAKLSLERWTVWPGPLVFSNALRHPLFQNQKLSCWFDGETRTLGWTVKNSRLENYNTSVHEVIAAFLASPSRETRSPKHSRNKRKGLSQFDLDEEPPAKKSKSQSDIVQGRDSSISSTADTWPSIPNPVLQSLLKSTNPKKGETITGPKVLYQSRQGSSFDNTTSLPAPDPVSATAVSNSTTLGLTTPTTPPQLLAGSHNTSVRTPHIPCPVACEEEANPDLLGQAEDTALASSNVVSSGRNAVGNPSINAPSPTMNEMRDIIMSTSPPPGAPVIDSERCSITPNPSTATSQLPIATLDQPHVADPIPDISDAMLPVVNDFTDPNNLGDLILSTPNISEETIPRGSPDELIATGGSFFSASQSGDASRLLAISSHSQCSPELGIVPEDSTIGAAESSLAHDKIQFHDASPPGGNLEQASSPIVQPIDLDSSEVTAITESKEAEEGTAQLEFALNLDSSSCVAAGEVMLDAETVEEPPQILVSVASDPLETTCTASEGEHASLYALSGDSPTSPQERRGKESETMHEEDSLSRRSSTEEEFEPPTSDSATDTSIQPSVLAIDSDFGPKEVRRRKDDLDAGNFAANICSLPTDLDRWRMEIVYHRLDTDTELMCRLCLASSPEQIPILPADTPFHLLAGHCQEEHQEYYDLLMNLEVDQLQVIKTRLGGLTS